ncbi:MAG: xanthine dehydrogenase family protein molybdopterin-binding subunit, partial [Actinomycetota bacterium]|nr:xanthine dehydrogenase family protein molybdopterin-binding subunit [Actinomycetota bacterium]
MLTIATKVGADAWKPEAAGAATLGPIPSLPSAEDVLDLADVVQLACEPTVGFVKLEVGDDGVARLNLPRVELGQGITTAISMLIAEDLDMSLSMVEV